MGIRHLMQKKLLHSLQKVPCFSWEGRRVEKVMMRKFQGGSQLSGREDWLSKEAEEVVFNISWTQKAF